MFLRFQEILNKILLKHRKTQQYEQSKNSGDVLNIGI